MDNTPYLRQAYSIELDKDALLKLEDNIKKRSDEPLIIRLTASGLGYRNLNNTIYRHDKIRDCIPSYVYPDTKPIIENHNPKSSTKYGRVIAADYKETKYYSDFINKGIQLEDLTTQEYISLCKDTIIPFQNKNKNYNGLALTEVVGRIDNKEGIKKILDSEFLYVSIGAKPKRLICSECGQDQVEKICDHYPDRRENNIFMLAEELEYEELSFVKKPAYKFGKVTYIYDGYEFEAEPTNLKASVEIIYAKDFFKQAEGKKIICVDNICKVINEPEDKMRKTKEGQKVLNISYIDEFNAELLKDVKLSDSEEESNIDEALKLSDEVMGELTNRDFAICQKTEEGLKRRFPIHNVENTKAAIQLINKAEDLTDSEKEKAITCIGKAAKKQGIEFKLEDEEQEQESKEEKVTTFEDALAILKDSIEKVEFEEKEDGTVELKDSEKVNPFNEIFNMLISFSGNLKWAGDSLNSRITDYLVSCGKEAHEKGLFDSVQEEATTLKDSITSLEDEVSELEEQNRELNYAIRVNLIDDIVSAKQALKLVDSETEEEKKSLLKLSYEALIKQKQEFCKLANNLKDNAFNNNKEITTIQNPTLNDEEGSDKEEVDESNLNIQDSEAKDSLSEKEIVQLFRELFRNK